MSPAVPIPKTILRPTQGGAGICGTSPPLSRWRGATNAEGRSLGQPEAMALCLLSGVSCNPARANL